MSDPIFEAYQKMRDEDTHLVRDASGKPRKLYHGTNAEFDEFKSGVQTGGGLHGHGAFFFSALKDDAKSYAKRSVAQNGGKQRVVTVHLSMKNPKHIDIGDFYEMAEDKDWHTKLQAQGHDGVIARSKYAQNSDVNAEYVVFHPHQIKIIKG